MIDRDKVIATLTAAAEASDQPPLARRLIIHVMFNRMRFNPSRYGSTVAAVCLKRAQFSEWNGDAVDNRNLMRVAQLSLTDPVILDCAAAYDEVVGGAADASNGATHFYADSIPAPPWTQKATLAARVGNLLFWKDVP